ncbi:MAG: hypothetical protein QOE76_3758 [Frankiales bacterium]|jgi:hypothetical protein|nr:hypothetical protein [Frankiales bacterium]MDX6246035.1 hypothetical protein [Frankiales bacterium]
MLTATSEPAAGTERLSAEDGVCAAVGAATAQEPDDHSAKPTAAAARGSPIRPTTANVGTRDTRVPDPATRRGRREYVKKIVAPPPPVDAQTGPPTQVSSDQHGLATTEARHLMFI